MKRGWKPSWPIALWKPFSRRLQPIPQWKEDGNISVFSSYIFRHVSPVATNTSMKRGWKLVYEFERFRIKLALRCNQYLNEKRMETFNHNNNNTNNIIYFVATNTSMKRGWKRPLVLHTLVRSCSRVATNTSMKREWKLEVFQHHSDCPRYALLQPMPQWKEGGNSRSQSKANWMSLPCCCNNTSRGCGTGVDLLI